MTVGLLPLLRHRSYKSEPLSRVRLVVELDVRRLCIEAPIPFSGISKYFLKRGEEEEEERDKAHLGQCYPNQLEMPSWAQGEDARIRTLSVF